jgi:hypothetical protein
LVGCGEPLLDLAPCSVLGTRIHCSVYDEHDPEVNDDDTTTNVEIVIAESAFDRELDVDAEIDVFVHDHPNSDPPLEGDVPTGMVAGPGHDAEVVDATAEIDVYVPYDQYERGALTGWLRAARATSTSCSAIPGLPARSGTASFDPARRETAPIAGMMSACVRLRSARSCSRAARRPFPTRVATPGRRAPRVPSRNSPRHFCRGARS